MKKKNIAYTTKDDFKKMQSFLAELIVSATRKMATKDDLKNFATKDDLKNFATKDDLKNFATKDDLKIELSKYATKDDLLAFEKRQDAKFATKKDLEDAIDDLKNDIAKFKDELIFAYGKTQMSFLEVEHWGEQINNHEERISDLEQQKKMPIFSPA